VTFSFADTAAGVCGLAGLTIRASGTATALAVLFADGEPVATLTREDIPLEPGADFARLALPGLEATVEDPLHRWIVRFDDGEHGFALTFDAAGPPAELEPGEPAARAGGVAAYDQLCHVHGTAHVGTRTHEVRCLGQRGHSWGVPDWEHTDAVRVLAAWIDDGTGVVLRAIRPAGRAAHGDEASWAAVLGAAGNLRVDEPRLSTTYDDAGHPRRAGLELWVGADDDHPRRAVGEVVCGATVALGRLRLDCSFVRWRMAGRSGVGRYDVLRRA
jgi:hypothetical protein